MFWIKSIKYPCDVTWHRVWTSAENVLWLKFDLKIRKDLSFNNVKWRQSAVWLNCTYNFQLYIIYVFWISITFDDENWVAVDVLLCSSHQCSTMIYAYLYRNVNLYLVYQVGMHVYQYGWRKTYACLLLFFFHITTLWYYKIIQKFVKISKMYMVWNIYTK